MVPIVSFFLAAQFLIFFFADYPSYGIHIASYVLVYCFYRKNSQNKATEKISKHQVYIWLILALVLSLMRLLLDRHFMDGDDETYYYYDALFQPIARFALAMCIFTFFVFQSEGIEKWARKYTKGNVIISRFSDLSYEVYLTHQFILLAFWEFFPFLHCGVGLTLWVIISFVATIANTLILAWGKSLIIKKLNNYKNK